MKDKYKWKKVDKCNITDEFMILQGDGDRCVIGGWDIGESGIYIKVKDEDER